MSKRTLQSLFNQAYLGVMKQGRPSLVNGKCVYRGPDGLKCGVGHLVTDEECAGWDNSDAPITVLAERGKTPSWITSANISFLSCIQKAHDMAALSSSQFTSQFHTNMDQLAKLYGLTVPSYSEI